MFMPLINIFLKNATKQGRLMEMYVQIYDLLIYFFYINVFFSYKNDFVVVLSVKRLEETGMSFYRRVLRIL